MGYRLLLLGISTSSKENSAMATANSIIQTVLSTGVPLYNAGQKQQCADVYAAAASNLLDESARGRLQLDSNASTQLRNALAMPASDPDARAWQLRRGFDAQLASGTSQ